MKQPNPTPKNSLQSLKDSASKLGAHVGMLFFVGVACVYGFILLTINSLSNAEPTSEAVKSLNTSPHISAQVVDQLNQLKDNSVTVQTLFDEARRNPFSE